MGDLNSRRGRILGMDSEIDKQVINAEVPLGEMFGYATDIRSMTKGRQAIPWNLPVIVKCQRMYKKQL